jgi:hypothetical protein
VLIKGSAPTYKRAVNGGPDPMGAMFQNSLQEKEIEAEEKHAEIERKLARGERRKS